MFNGRLLDVRRGRRQRWGACSAVLTREGRCGAWPGAGGAGVDHPAHASSKGQVYVLSKEEGGRHTPFFNGYRPQFYRADDRRDRDVSTLPAGTEMVMPGDDVELECRAGVRRLRSKTVSASRFARAAARSAPASSPRSSSRRPSTNDELRERAIKLCATSLAWSATTARGVTFTILRRTSGK